VATGQTPDPAPSGFGRFALHLGGGPLLKSGGYNVSAGLGFSPISRIDLMVNVERHHLPFERESFRGQRRAPRVALSAAPRLAVRLRGYWRRHVPPDGER
jgi:hypothetical protein